jgi:uncharacterized protein YcfJ
MNWFSSKMSSKEFALHMVIIVLCTSFISGFAFGNTHRGQARAEANVMGQTRDVYKTVIQQKPYTVEVCKQVQVPGDKTADTVVGTILGGVIGHQIDHKDGAKIGGVLGGIIGNQNSKAVGGTQTQCQTETRYEEETVEVYSHSVVTFWDNGKEYRVRYQK